MGGFNTFLAQGGFIASHRALGAEQMVDRTQQVNTAGKRQADAILKKEDSLSDIMAKAQRREGWVKSLAPLGHLGPWALSGAPGKV